LRAILLFPLTIIYFIAIKIWDIFWSVKKPIKLSSKVISVGNITVGGTGKTSLVKYIAKKLIADNKSVAVIARGYKRPDSQFEIICSDDFNDWRECGDEPAMLARSIRDLKIYVGSDKTNSACRAAKDNYEYLIIDDGFQHRKLARNLNIVCVDGSDPFGNRLLLPSGKLREPLNALNRADCIILFGEDFESDFKLPVQKNIPVFNAHKKVVGIKNKTGEIIKFENKKALAFCGIGNPHSFQNSLTNIDLQIMKIRRFGDHYVYDNIDIDSIISDFKNTGSDFIITTMKDFIKLENIWPVDYPLYYLDVEVEIENRESFFKLIK
jgi:tetraacyldisaccharide 4'-kinase